MSGVLFRNDTVYQEITSRLTLKDQDKTTNSHHVLKVIENMIIPQMRKIDDLFDHMYQRLIFGGSYYKGTKVGEPDEFDLDLIVKLPISYDKISIDTNHPKYGYIKIKIDEGRFDEKYRAIVSTWVTDQGYLNQNKFRQWMQSVFTKVYNQLPPRTSDKEYGISLSSSGPAYTVILTTPDNTNKISIDLVPALEFVNTPLGNGYRQLSGNKKSWLAVAKPLDDSQWENCTLWRLCFYEQERDFLRDDLNGEIKPVIRMMKKFRDTQDWKSLCSYFIETLFYHMLEECQNNRSESLSRFSRTTVFMKALKELEKALTTKTLKYFWHPKYNLLEKISASTLENWAQSLGRIIKKIEDDFESNPNVTMQGSKLAEAVLGGKEGQKSSIGGLDRNMSGLRVY